MQTSEAFAGVPGTVVTVPGFAFVPCLALQPSVGRRKQLVLWVGQPEQMWSITFQAASPNLGGWKLGSEYHHVQEAVLVLARVQWNKWVCFFWHSFRSCYMAGFLSLAFFRALHQVPRGFQDEWDSCCSPLGYIAKIPFLSEHLPFQVCVIMRKFVEGVFPSPVEQHRSVIAVSQACVQLSWWDTAIGKQEPSWDTTAEKTGHGLMAFIQFKLETNCFSSEPLKCFVSGTCLKQQFQDHAVP